jgi:prohead serine protease
VTILIDPQDLRFQETMQRKYGARNQGPIFARLPIKDSSDNRSPLSVEGSAVKLNHPILNKDGQILVFEKDCFDSHFNTVRHVEFQLAHDATRIIGSTDDGLEICIVGDIVAFRLPLNQHHAPKIKGLIESGKQAAISVGVTRTKERVERIAGQDVIFIEQAVITEISLVAEGACKQAFARLIDPNDEPPLDKSVTSPMFRTEQSIHHLKVLAKEMDRAIEAKVAALEVEAESQHVRRPISYAAMERRVNADRDEFLAAERKKRLGQN